MKRKPIRFAVFCIFAILSGLAACQSADSMSVPSPTHLNEPTQESTRTKTYTSTDSPTPTVKIKTTKTPSPTATEALVSTGTNYFLTPTMMNWQTREALTATNGDGSPTPYATFNPQTVVTVPPAQAAICPVENPDFVFSDEMEYLLETSYDLRLFTDLALNSGASFRQIEEKTDYLDEVRESIYLQDLTGDGVNELIVGNYGTAGIGVFTCDRGKYRMIIQYSAFALGGMAPPFIFSVEDLNLDHQPEIVLQMALSTGANTSVDILSWDEYQFVSKAIANRNYTAQIDPRLANGLYWYYDEKSDWWNFYDYPFEMNFVADIKVRDMDRNGTKEIILNDDGPVHYDTVWNFGPWRGQEVTFEWDGNAFVLSDYRIDAPEYRFQALQEADRAFLLREYDRALQLYDDVINSTTLKPWSMDYMQYLEDVHFAQDPDSVDKPEMTLNEYQHLSAYARYRVMMIQLAQGKQSEALNTYQLLDQIFTEANPGFAYAEIGRTYWKAVVDGADLVRACQIVTDYMSEHRDLLADLGDWQHGGQSHEYAVEDICPMDETDVMLLSGEGE